MQAKDEAFARRVFGFCLLLAREPSADGSELLTTDPESYSAITCFFVIVRSFFFTFLSAICAERDCAIVPI